MGFFEETTRWVIILSCALIVVLALLEGCGLPVDAQLGLFELRAVEAADSVWDEERPNVCPYTEPERLHVFYGTQQEVSELCQSRTLVLECAFARKPGGVHAFEGFIAVATTGDPDAGEISDRTRASLIQHGYNHLRRGCWTYYDIVNRWPEEGLCRSPTMQDGEHCDSFLWREMRTEMMLRFLESWP